MTMRFNTAVPGFALAGLALTLGGCGHSTAGQAQSKPQAAVTTFAVDGSASTAFISSPAYADEAIRHVGQEVMQEKLGDRDRIIAFGNRSAENAVDVLSEQSGYRRRLPAVRMHVEAALNGLMDRNRQSGGEGSTNILYSLENAGIVCAPRSRLLVLSDGIAEDENYSAAKALAAAKPVHLPPPNAAYLKGCSVEFVGIGMAPQGGQTLSNDKVQALVAGWREYLTAAGVRAEDMRFTSVL